MNLRTLTSLGLELFEAALLTGSQGPGIFELGVLNSGELPLICCTASVSQLKVIHSGLGNHRHWHVCR